MSKIYEAFRNNKAFIAFITCGYPDIESSKRYIREIADNGADLIELGIPFSDPTAEGPVIQEANLRALNSGITTAKVFDMVRELRRDISIPLVFMTYANVIFSYGPEKFIKTCTEVGVDGLIVPDLPFEEKHEFSPFCDKYGVDLISMIAPTSEKRIAMIAREAQGFIYVVSSLGVTGVRSKINTDLSAIIHAIRDNSDLPCAVGFGISTPEQAREIAKISDGIIVGSAIIKVIASSGNVGEYVKSMKNACNDVVRP